MELLKHLSLTIASTGFIILAAASQAFAQAITLEYDSQIGRPANLAEGELPGALGTLAVPQGIAVQEEKMALATWVILAVIEF